MKMPQVPSFIKTPVDWLKQNRGILLLSLLIACTSIPDYSLVFDPGIDGPLPWVFNYFADGHYMTGKDLLFPHGPLAFLLYPLPMGHNLEATIIITLLLSFLLSLVAFRIYFIKNEGSYLAPFVLILLMQSVCEIQLLLVALTLSYSFLYHLDAKKKNLAWAAFFCVLNLYIKSYGGILSLCVFFSAVIAGYFRNKDLKTLLAGLAFLALFFLSFWLALYQTLSGSLRFLVGQYELSSDNSEAVSFYPDNNWWYLSLCLSALALIPFFTRDKWTRHLCLLMALPFFAAWKHAMARADAAHSGGFLSLLLFFSFMLWLCSDEKKTRVIFLSLLSVIGFTLNMAHNTDLYSPPKDPTPFNLCNLVLNYDSITHLKNRYSYNKSLRNKLPDTLLRIIGNKTVDVLPWNYSIIAINKLHWVPRPTIHGYATYTRWLDEENARHIASDHSAKYLLWEISENGGKFSGIDFRYLLNDGPQMMKTIFSHYALRFKSGEYFLFEKRLTPLRPEIVEISPAQSYAFNTWIDVPLGSGKGVTRAKITFRKNILGNIKSLLYKGEGFSISYETADKQVHVKKIVPKNALDGVWVNPLVLQPENNSGEPEVKRIKIICYGDAMVQPEFSLQFEELVYDRAVDFAAMYFNKR